MRTTASSRSTLEKPHSRRATRSVYSVPLRASSMPSTSAGARTALPTCRSIPPRTRALPWAVAQVRPRAPPRLACAYSSRVKKRGPSGVLRPSSTQVQPRAVELSVSRRSVGSLVGST